MLTATATRSDVDADTITLTYVWKVNGTVRKTTAGSSSLTDTFDLAGVGNGDGGDTVSVEVTPSDGTASGTTVSAQAIVSVVPTFRSASTADNASTTSLSVTRPAGVVTGDALLAVVDVRGAPTITAPAGWTLVRVDNNGTTLKQAVYIKIAGSTEATSYAWSFSSTQAAAATILAYVGVHATSPIDASSGGVNSSSTSILARP